MKRKIKHLRKYDDGYTRFVNSPVAEEIVVRPDNAGGNYVQPNLNYLNWDPNIRYLIGGQNGTYHVGIPAYDNSWLNYWGNVGAGYVNKALEAAAPIVGGTLLAAATLPTTALGAGALGGVGMSRILPLARTVAGETAAAELAGQAWNGIYKGLSGKNWSTGLADNIESATGWRPSEEATGLLNPGYFMGGAAKKGVELTADAMKGADNLLWKGTQAANGRWVTVGNKQLRLNPNTLGANGRPLETRNINPVMGTQTYRSVLPEAEAVSQRVINAPVINNSASGTPILSDSRRVWNAARNGGAEFDEVLDAISNESGVPREVIDSYASANNVNFSNRYDRSDFLYDYGFRHGSQTGRAPMFYRLGDHINLYKLGVRVNDILTNGQDLLSSVFDQLASQTGTNSKRLRSLFKSRGIDDEHVANLLSKDGATISTAMRDLVDDFKNIRMIDALGGNVNSVIDPERLKILQQGGFSKEDIINAVLDGHNNITNYFNNISGFSNAVKNYLLKYPEANIKKVFDGIDPRFIAGEGPTFNNHELKILFDEFYRGNTIHPNLERGTPKSEVVNTIRKKMMEAERSPEFSIRETLGGDFSADSSPMILSMISKLSDTRAAQGKFPGQIIVGPGTRSGNGLANVNLAKPGETPYINGGFLRDGVDPPTVEEIAKFPTRLQAVNKINMNLAKAYKAIIENNRGLKNVPDYGLDENMINAVIKAKGDIRSVTGAGDATFGGEGITPVWAEFPSDALRPEYPALKFIFDKGKSIKPAKKRKRIQ